MGMHAAGNLLFYARGKKFPLSEGEDSNSGIPEEKRMIRIMIIISQACNAVKAVLTEGTRRNAFLLSIPGEITPNTGFSFFDVGIYVQRGRGTGV